MKRCGPDIWQGSILLNLPISKQLKIGIWEKPNRCRIKTRIHGRLRKKEVAKTNLKPLIMNKLKFKGSLSLNKETISELNDEHMGAIRGGDDEA